MLGVVAGTTFLSGSSRMWTSEGDKSNLAFYSNLFNELFTPEPICRIHWWVGVDHTGWFASCEESGRWQLEPLLLNPHFKLTVPQLTTIPIVWDLVVGVDYTGWFGSCESW